jgi:hypothetical protein
MNFSQCWNILYDDEFLFKKDYKKKLFLHNRLTFFSIASPTARMLRCPFF